MIGQLICNCAVLVVVIHGLRALSRRLGPRAGGWALGLPSTTAVMLVLHGRSHGRASAATMAEAGLLGLVATVVLPLAYAAGVRRGWRLPGALTAAIAVDLAVGSALGWLHPEGMSIRLALAFGAIAATVFLARRIGPPRAERPRPRQSVRSAALLRVAVPVFYVVAVETIGAVLGPSWAGLLATFPSMSVVVLAVTHLEAGPGEAARMARALPAANLSTAAFLAVFRLGCAEFGLLAGTIAGQAAAFLNLAVLAGLAARRERPIAPCSPGSRRRGRRLRPISPWAGTGPTKPRRRMALRGPSNSCTVRPTSGHAPWDARRGLASFRRSSLPRPGRVGRAAQARRWIAENRNQRGPPRRGHFRTAGSGPGTPGRRDRSHWWTGCFPGGPTAGG